MGTRYTQYQSIDDFHFESWKFFLLVLNKLQMRSPQVSKVHQDVLKAHAEHGVGVQTYKA